MNSTDRIIEALKAGVSPDADESVKEARDQLKSAIEGLLADSPEGIIALKKFLANPGGVWEPVLRECLGEAEVEKAEPIVIQADHIQGLIQAEKIGQVNQYFGTEPPEKLLKRYLSGLAAETDHLPWAHVDPDHADPKKGEGPSLTEVYTALDTTELERPMKAEDEVRGYLDQQKKLRRISAHEILNGRDRLVLLGDPGSGKSTIVNFITHILAQAALSTDSDTWLNRLRETGPWDHGPLLPVRVILRHFAADLDSGAHCDHAEPLTCFLEKIHKEVWPRLAERLADSKTPCLVLLDGLDEVPSDLRKKVARIIEAFIHRYSENRYLVTCRIYAYVGQDYQLHGFRQATLTPFSKEQIEHFITTWYAELARKNQFTSKEAKERANRLKSAVIRPDLRGLAERPLLLTVMALLHTFRGQLPEDRVELYQWAIDLLLRRWEARVSGEDGLLEKLDLPGLKMNDLEAGLYDVAYHVHAGAGEGETADVAEGVLRERIAPYLNEDWNKAGIFVAHVRERAGLLIRHKPDAYTFPHRTFQEFMAACHLAGLPDYIDKAADLVDQDSVRWRIVFVLAAGHAARSNQLALAISSVNALCPERVEEFKNPDAGDFEKAVIAGEALIEIGLIGVGRRPEGRPLLKRVKDWLLAAMAAGGVLEPEKRVEAGNILSRLGDPRFDPDFYYLPCEENFGFIEIPAGPFLMGSDEKLDKDFKKEELPQRKVELSAFAISKYPVTVAQYRAFAEDTKRGSDDYWHKWNKSGNHPVVYVSWQDAVDYCKWLTDKIRGRGFDWTIQLPTEAQWEKSARGTDGRIFPWGDEADPDLMNFDRRISSTSPAGCFPGGNSPYGLHDTIGNVWEWCQDWYAEYSKNASVDPKGPARGVVYRVMRGGSWSDDGWVCWSAHRGCAAPDYQGNFIGFRLSRSLP